VAASLTIWLGSLEVATVERDGRGRLTLSYTQGAQQEFEGGTPVLSVSLPVRPKRFANQVTTAFLDGLLPEEEPRRAIAAELDVAASDVFSLLAALGRDCAGALVIQPANTPPPPTASTANAERINQDSLEDLVANLRSAPLGVGGRVRLSLAGVQEKLLLTRMPDGSWGRPVDGSPSTHILKPAIEGFPDVVANEAFCMRLAFHLGLSVASVETTSVGDREVIVIERFDRQVGADASVVRVHQEDFCQALGVPPNKKYEADGGPSLAQVAEILKGFAASEDLAALLSAVTLNVAVGNCDAHGKNFSLLHLESGALRLAPLYDVLSTRLYDGLSDHLAMSIDTLQVADRVTGERIVNEATSWGMSHREATEVVDDLLDRLPEAITAAADQTPGVPNRLVAYTKQRAAELRGG